MKTRVYLSCIIVALVASLSLISYTSASVDTDRTNTNNLAQQTTPVLHPTPTPVSHTGHMVGVCVRLETTPETSHFTIIDESEIGVHRAHGDIVGAHSQADCPTSTDHASTTSSSSGSPLNASVENNMTSKNGGANTSATSQQPRTSLLPVTGNAADYTWVTLIGAAGVALFTLSGLLRKIRQ